MPLTLPSPSRFGRSNVPKGMLWDIFFALKCQCSLPCLPHLFRSLWATRAVALSFFPCLALCLERHRTKQWDGKVVIAPSRDGNRTRMGLLQPCFLWRLLRSPICFRKPSKVASRIAIRKVPKSKMPTALTTHQSAIKSHRPTARIGIPCLRSKCLRYLRSFNLKGSDADGAVAAFRAAG